MICGFEALVKMEEERIKREEEERRQKEEEERKHREYVEECKTKTIPFCDKELTKHIEKKIEKNEAIEIAIRHKEKSKELIDVCVFVYDCYANGDSAYDRIGYDIHYDTFIKYVTSHCWAIINEKTISDVIYGLGRSTYHPLIKFELTPSPDCLTII